MKKLIFIAFMGAIALTSCKPTKPNSVDSSTKIELTDPSQVDDILNRMKSEMYVLDMVSNDVVTNGDAIIATEEKISNIINQVEEHKDMLNEAQLERFDSLRQEYKKKSGY